LDEKQIQDLFRATDEGDAERVSRCLHPDVVVTMIGVDGVDEPFDRAGYLRFLQESIAYRSGRGERTEHIPEKIRIGGTRVAIRGHLRITSPDAADDYHPYTDVWNLRDGRIVDYFIAYDL
jgi:ketosteroid isomerase-like protein